MFLLGALAPLALAPPDPASRLDFFLIRAVTLPEPSHLSGLALE